MPSAAERLSAVNDSLCAAAIALADRAKAADQPAAAAQYASAAAMLALAMKGVPIGGTPGAKD
jgi:hypothetical protein